MATDTLPILTNTDLPKCLCYYFLINFVNEVFIIKVTVKKNSFIWKLEKMCYNVASLKFFLNAKQYITAANERDKVSILFL